MMEKKYIVALIALGICAPVWHTVEAHERNGTYELPGVLVTEDRNQSFSGGDVHRETRLGVLGNVDFMAAPVNSIALTRQVLDQNAQPGRAFFDTVTRHPSVLVGGCSTDNNVELAVRGVRFNTYDVLVDGMPGLMAMANNSLNWVERVEVTAGANSALQGATAYRSATGAINMVPKRSTEKPMAKFTETFSGKNIWTHSIDVGAPLGKSGLGVRLNGQLSKGNTNISREHIQLNNIFINMDYRAKGSYTSVLAGYEDSKHYGMPEIVLLKNNVWKNTVTKLPDADRVIDNFMPEWSELSRTRKMVLIQHEQNLSDSMSAFARFGMQSINYYGYLDSKPELLNDKGDYKLSISGNMSQSRFLRHSLSVGFKGNIYTGSIEHRYTIGYDRLSSMNEWSSGKGGTKSTMMDGNLFDATPLSKFTKPVVAPANYYAGNDDVYSSIYAMDYMSLADNRTHLLLGARQQTIKTMSFSKTKWIPAIGAVYRVMPNVSLYGAYSESLDTKTAPKDSANAGETFKPFATKQYEIGVKAEFGDVSGSMSYFFVDQPQMIQTGKVISDKAVYAMDGTAQYQGLEFNVFGKLSDTLSIQGGMAFISTNMKKMPNSALNGKEAQGVARMNATLGLRWDTSVEGLSIDSRVQYVGSSYADAMNEIKVPGWLRTDLGATYEFGGEENPMMIRTMVYNVFDKHYWSTTAVPWGNQGLMLNPGRNVMVSLSAQW